MSLINQYIKDNITKVAAVRKRCYISPNIDSKHLNNAAKAFEYGGDPAAILGIIDSTPFGSAKSGALLTGDRFIYKGHLEKPITVLFENLEKAEEHVDVKRRGNDKIKTENQLIITTKSGDEHVLRLFEEADFKELADLLNYISTEFTEFKEQSQLEPIEKLSNALKVAYVKVITNMLREGDFGGDKSTLATLYYLMARINLPTEQRMKIQSYLSEDSNLETVSSLVDTLNQEAPDGMISSVHFSLLKDLIDVYSVATSKDGRRNVTGDFDFLSANLKLLNVTKEQIAVAIEAIELDEKYLNREYSDNALRQGVTQLSASVASIGLPMGAVYLSGSVAGFSAAGITSGLSFLGFGGILGFSSMLTGVGTVIVIGVAAYKGIQRLGSLGATDGDKRREILLQEVIRLGQQTTSMIIEDVNSLVVSLNKALASESVTKEKLQELFKKVQVLMSATSVISDNSIVNESNRERLRSPEYLDVKRLELLTDEAHNAQYRDFILSFYEPAIKPETEEEALQLKKGRSIDEMRDLGNAFEIIGYNSGTAVAKKEAAAFASEASAITREKASEAREKASEAFGSLRGRMRKFLDEKDSQ